MVPITGRAGTLLVFLKLQSQSKLNPNQIQSIFCSPYFLCLQCQSDLSDSLPSSPVLVIFSSSVSTANLRFLLVTTFSSLSFLSNSFSSPRFNFLRVNRRCFSWSSVSDDLFCSSCNFLGYPSCSIFSRPILSLSFLCSSVSEALFALSFPFLS